VVGADTITQLKFMHAGVNFVGSGDVFTRVCTVPH